MRHIAYCLVSVFVIAGCATTVPSSSEQIPAPPDQVFFVSEKPSQDTSRVVFIRDAGLLGAAIFIHLYIDGEKAASLSTAEVVDLNIRSGEHTFGVIPTDPFNLAQMYSIDQDLKAGRTYRYRLSQTTQGSLISRVIEPNNKSTITTSQ